MAPPSRRRLGPPTRDSVYEAASSSDPFNILAAEHALLRQRFARVLAAAADGSDRASIRGTLGALSESLEIHQRREDLVLYPLCESLFGGKLGAAAVLRDDHAAIERQVDALLRASQATGRVPRHQLDSLRHAVDEHFGKEERILFPLTAALLSGTESTALARRLRGASLEKAADRL